MDVQIRTRLLAAALADHDGLAAALTAAKDAEAWLQGGQVPAPVPVYFLPAPMAASVDWNVWAGAPELEIVRDGDPAIATPAPAPPPSENGHDTRSEPAPAPAGPAGPIAAPRRTCAAPGATPSWLGATVAAARDIAARGDRITPATISAELAIGAAAAGWRLREMLKAGHVTSSGVSNQTQYHLVDQTGAEAPAPSVPEPAETPIAEPPALDGNPATVIGTLLQQAGHYVDTEQLQAWQDQCDAPAPASAKAVSFRPRSRADGAPEWQDATMEACRTIEARFGHIRLKDVAFALNLTPGAAAWRLKVMVDDGLLTVTGKTNNRRYQLAAAAPIAEPAAAMPEPAAPPAQAPPAAVPPPAPRPATLRPRPPVLIGSGLRPVAPPPPMVRQAAPMRTTMDDVVAFLRGQGWAVRGGPQSFHCAGEVVTASDLLAKANLIRSGMQKPPLTVDSVAAG
ncbi:hypothetical protein [Inquilinus sp. CA228]|uniref:hypothetical protein n=1 Tax=Inquilinus sp. CA228 TaxID=3455609 RepID=UPI003F8D751C